MKTNQYTLWKLALTVTLSLSAAWQSQARTWSATPEDNKFSNNANWSDTSGAIWYFGASSTTNLLNDLDAAPVIQEINYRNAAYSISGGTIALTAQIRNQMTVSQTIGSTLWLQGNIKFQNDTPGGDFYLTGTVVNYGGDRTLTTDLKGNTLHIGALAVSEGDTARMFTLSGTDQTFIGSVTGSGAAFNNSGFGGFHNRLVNTLTITGSGSYTGDVTLGQVSNTILDYTAGDGARLGFGGALNVRSNATLTLHGGGTAAVENFSSLTLGWGKDYSGHTEILRDSGSATIRISGDLRRAAGTNIWENHATLSISGSNLVYAPNATTLSGDILFHYVTISGKDWAKVDADTGALVAFDDYVNFDTATATDHAVIDGNATLTGNKTVGTLKITTDAAGQSLNLDGRQLSFTATSVSGASNGGAAGIYGAYNGSGMIFAGDHDYTISGGVLATGWQTEFLLWTGGAGALNIASNINGNIITKSGAGTLILSGSLLNINSHFSINQGQVVIGSEASASTFGKAVLNLSGGVLDLNGYDVTNTGGFLNPGNGTGVTGLLAGGTITNNAATQSVYTVAAGGSFGRMVESTLITGNLQLVLSNFNDAYARPYTANTYTGGTVLRDMDSKLGGGQLQIGTPLFFGPGQISMEGNASLYMFDGTWTSFANDLHFTSTNNAIMVGRDFTGSGAWSGDGVVHLQTTGVAQSLTGDLSQFTGVLNFSAGFTGRGGDGGTGTLKLAAGTDLGGSLVLFDSATGAGKTSTLTVQASAAGTIKLAELSTWSAANNSAQFAANSSATVSAAAAGLVTFEVGGGTFGGQLADGSGQVAINKVGTGTWALTGSNSYSGSTTVSGGVLLVDDEGSINSTNRITIDSGEFRYNSSTALTAATYVEANGVLGGSGVIGTDNINLAASGDAGVTGGGLGTTGMLTFSVEQAFWGDFTYYFDIRSDTDHDQLNFSDGMIFQDGDQITLNVNLGGLEQFDDVPIISGQLTDYDQTTWQLGEGFSLFYDTSKHELLLSYAAIPEPSTWLLLGTGVALLAFLRRRR
ncbi:MAG: autotransporter-associated beta strand repeat-containing protein [Verrucomicrobiales bacterium]|jgi:autotransporter-associated beta strand protein|nr:autotransporter-associated beta strand repeat-containing protein [Verrucomicrobiales bacterium]